MHVEQLIASVQAALGTSVVAASPLSGGDVAVSLRLTLATGRVVFAKTLADPPPDVFDTESSGLGWLRVPGGVAVPEVVAVGRDHLVLEWIDESRGGPDDALDREFGSGLARIHDVGAPCFGRADRRATGSRRLPNEPVTTWAEHFAANRLLPLARRWHDQPGLPADTASRLERLAGRLDQLGVPDEPPARLHGDLWAGNRLVGRRPGDDRKRNWLIDPAAHGGHREFDLAMMLLFGGFGPACFEGYAEVAALAPDWRQRVPLHQLAPLAVHAIKFGGGYVAATARALDTIERSAT